MPLMHQWYPRPLGTSVNRVLRYSIPVQGSLVFPDKLGTNWGSVPPGRRRDGGSLCSILYQPDISFLGTWCETQLESGWFESQQWSLPAVSCVDVCSAGENTPALSPDRHSHTWPSLYQILHPDSLTVFIFLLPACCQEHGKMFSKCLIWA